VGAGSDVAGVLIERERELEVLRAAHAAAVVGEGGLVVVQGEPGIGKTRLLQELRSHARAAGTVTLEARGGELEGGMPYGIVRQLFERRLAIATDAERASLQSGVAGLAAMAIQDDPARVLEGTSIDHGLYWLVANLAELEPIALLIDDAHWSDAASLRFLVYLARRLEGLPVLLVVATRLLDVGASRRELELLTAEPAATVVRLAAFSPDGSWRLLAARLGAQVAPAAALASHVSSGGNPFFLTEIAGALRDARMTADAAAVAHIRDLAPATVSRALLLRLGRLGEVARCVAEALAVLGTGRWLTDLQAVSGCDRDDVLIALEQLSAAGLTACDEHIELSHPIVRHAIYADLSQARRWRLHDRAARALSARAAPRETVAQHLLQTEPAGDPQALATLCWLADQASLRGDADTAERALERALREQPGPSQRARLLVELGEAQLAAGSSAAGQTTLHDALRIDLEPMQRVRVALRLSSALAACGTIAKGIALLEEQARVLDGDHALRLEVQHAMLAVWVKDLAADAQARMHAFGELPGATAAQRIGLANAALATAFDPHGEARLAVNIAMRALNVGAMLADDVAAAPIMVGMATYVLVMGESFTAADDEHARLAAVARDRGVPELYATSGLLSCQAALARGQLAVAAAHGEAAWEGFRVLEETAVTQRAIAFAGSWLVEIQLLRGEPDAARDVIAAARDAGYFERPEFVWLRYGRGLVGLHDGDARGALDDLASFGAAARAGGYEDRQMVWRLAAARAHAILGEAAAALALADEQLALARTWAAPAGLGRAMRARAHLLGRDGAPMLVDAIAVLRDSEGRAELAAALVDAGLVMRRRAQRTAARTYLSEGMELAARCEAWPLAELARTELRVLGARPRRMMFSGVQALTATERRVASLAATGLTNREIAQALFVSPKTIESHLSRVYGKLSISSRTELPADLA
jgi:DNA-binding CsgD family transcriptional regulator